MSKIHHHVNVVIWQNTSYELRVTSELKAQKARAQIQKWEFRFTSYEFKSTNFEFNFISYDFKSTSSRII